MFDDPSRKDIALEYANLLQEQENLLQEQDACNNQYRSTIDDAQKVVLKRKLENLQQKIDEINRKTPEIDNQLRIKDLCKNTNRRELALKQKMPQIDFKEAIKLVNKILNKFDEYGAAVFLINDSCNMAGDLFALELKDLLESDTTDFKYYEIAFSLGNRLDEIGFLQGIAGHLGVGIEEVESQEHYPKVIEKIFNSLENGSIVFVEIRKMDLLDNQESFLFWLVNVFWKALVEKLPLICKLKEIEQIRFIMIVVSDDNIEEECLGLPFFCQEHDFEMCRVLRIPLQDWSEKEIRTWLTRHSGLPTDKISPMAKNIYKSSRGGTPKLICEALKNKLS